MANIIEMIVALCVFHSLLSLWESIKNFQPTTKPQRLYSGRCLNDKGKVIT